MKWSHKFPAEILPLGVECSDLLADGETIIAVSAAISVVTGADVSVSAMLLGSAEIVGTSVQQWIVAGVDGAVYTLLFTLDTSLGKRLVVGGLIPVVAPI